MITPKPPMITTIVNTIDITLNMIGSKTSKMNTIINKTATIISKIHTTTNKIRPNTNKTATIANKICANMIETSSNRYKTRPNDDKIIDNQNKRFKIQDKAIPTAPPIPSQLSTLAKRTNQPCNPNFAKELISPSHANALFKGSTSIEKKDYICLKMNKIRAAHNTRS